MRHWLRKLQQSCTRQTTPGRPAARRSAAFRVEELEARLVPVVGANAIPPAIVPGVPLPPAQLEQAPLGLDGVVKIVAPDHTFGTGSLLTTGDDILTAAHVVVRNNGLTPMVGTFQIIFQLPAGTITMPVTVTAANPTANIKLAPGWNGNTANGNDLAVIHLPAVAPFGAQEYPLYQGAADVGSRTTFAGYGRTGVGAVGTEVNEIQQITIQNPTAAGTFQLSFNGGPLTAPISQTANATAVMQALSVILGSGNVAVSNRGLPPGSWMVQFLGQLRFAPQNPLAVANVTGGKAVAVNEINAGNPANTGVKRAGRNTFDAALAANNDLTFQFVAGDPARSATTASGDSGGPAFVWNAAANDWEIAGVSSYGITTPQTVSNYVTLQQTATGGWAVTRVVVSDFGDTAYEARVSSFVNWITQTETAFAAASPLVLDMNYQVVGGALPPQAATITAQTNGGNLQLVVKDPATGSSNVYYSAPLPAGGSLDIIGSAANETVVIAGNVGARAISVQGKGGDDTLELDFTTGDPIPAGGITFDGGGGRNSIVANADADYTLTDTGLTIGGMGAVALKNVQDATLTGGPDSRVFAVGGWTGTALLNGDAGDTTLDVAVNGVVSLSDGMLRRPGRGDVTLYNISQAYLHGGPGDDRFVIDRWSGTADVTTGAGTNTVVLSGGSPTVTIDGSGGDSTVMVTGGSVTADSISDVSNLQVSAGTLNLAGDASVTTLALSGGTVTGDGNLTLTGGGAQAGSWTGGTLAGAVAGVGGAVTLAPGALLNVNGLSDKTANRIVNNGGTIEVQAGTVAFRQGGNDPTKSGGTFTVDAGAAMTFAANVPFVLGDVSGAGNVAFPGGTALVQGTYDIDGETDVFGGTVKFTNPTDTGRLAFGRGTVSPIAPLIVRGNFDWWGGKLSGPVVAAGSLNINGDAAKTLYGVLTALGQTTWSGAGPLSMVGASATFENEGALTVQTAAVVTNPNSKDYSVAFNNDGGTVEVAVGPLTLGDGVRYTQSYGTTTIDGGETFQSALNYIQTGGTTDVRAGGYLKLPLGGQVDIQGGVLSGLGYVLADVTNSGQVNPGDNGATGTLSIYGDYVQNGGGNLNIQLGGVGPGQYDQLTTADATLGGTLNVSTANGFVPQVGDSFKVLNYDIRQVDADGQPTDFTTETGLQLNATDRLNPNYLDGPTTGSLTLNVTGGLQGTVFNDLNGTGVRAANDPGLPGVMVQLSASINGLLLPIGPPAVTDAAGNYSFSGLIPGTYVVTEMLPAGWQQTSPAGNTYTLTLPLVPGAQATGLDFGIVQPGQIKGVAFNDANGNGTQDTGEWGLAGWTVELLQNNVMQASTTTDSNGNYEFSNVLPGTYIVTEEVQPGWQAEVPGSSSAVSVSSGQSLIGPDFANVLSSVASGPWTVSPGGPGYSETGTWSTGQPGYDAVTGRYTNVVSPQDAPTATATYEVDNLAPGSYDLYTSWFLDPVLGTVNAPYQIYDGSTLLGTVLVNQQNEPGFGSAPGSQDLGIYDITSGTLRVVLGNNASAPEGQGSLAIVNAGDLTVTPVSVAAPANFAFVAAVLALGSAPGSTAPPVPSGAVNPVPTAAVSQAPSPAAVTGQPVAAGSASPLMAALAGTASDPLAAGAIDSLFASAVPQPA